MNKKRNIFFFSLVPSVPLVFFIASVFSVSLASSQISRVSYFNGIILGNDIRLDFTISQGSPCNGYQVLKSLDSTNYNVLMDYAGICGNSSTDESFNYLDAGVQKETYLYYKIFLPPFDYSKTLKMYVDPKKTRKNMLYTYPQPVETTFNIYLDKDNYDDYTLRIIDCNGILKQQYQETAYKNMKVDMTGYEKGIYCILLIDSSGDFARGKIIKH